MILMLCNLCFLSKNERKAVELHKDEKFSELYLRLNDSNIIESQEVSPGVVLDFNESNQVVGIAMLNLSHRTLQLNLDELQYQTA